MTRSRAAVSTQCFRHDGPDHDEDLALDGTRPDPRPELTETERANLRRAPRFLQVRAGSGAKLAALLGVARLTLDRATGKRAKGSVLLSLRAARLAKKTSVEAVLGERGPPEGACPHCGRG